MRRVLAWFSAVVVTLGVATVPSVAAAQTTRSTTSFATTCYIAAPSVAGMGGPIDITPQNPVQIHVTSPASVDVGDTFQVTFDIDPINVSLDSLPGAVSLRQASRLKLDLQRPAGTRLVGYSFSGGNIDVHDAQIITVNEGGAPDANGNILRLTNKGHHTVGNGGNVSQNSHSGLGMDLTGANSLDFAFPRVTLTFQAERAGTAAIGVRTQGAAGGYGPNPASFLTLLASASVPILGTQWVPGFCSPRGSATAPIDQGAASMKSIEIVGLPTSSTLTGPETVFLRTPAEFVASVQPAIPGEVTFVSGAQRVTVPAVSGQARAELTFTTQPDGPVRAIFTPTDPRYATAVSELPITVERLATQMTLDAPATTDANIRTALSVSLPSEARGTVTFTGGGQERTVDVRDGRAATSLTFTESGNSEVQATFAPSATSPYAAATASASILVTESTSTTLVLNGLDTPGYVAGPLTLEAVINPAEGTENPQGRVEFRAGSETQIVDVLNGRAAAEFLFGRAGDVEVSATYHPAGADQTRASDSGTLRIVDAVSSDSDLVGPVEAEPGRSTAYTIVVSPAGAEGTADVRIDGRVVARDVAIIDGEGRLDLTFPPAAVTERKVTVEFTPADTRVLRPHSAVHTIRVEASAVHEDALSMVVTGPKGVLEPGQSAAVRVELLPADQLGSPATLNGYLTVSNNGEPVLGADDQPVRIAVTRGIADVDVAWTSGYPEAKFLQFTYHSPDGTERVSGGINVTVIGEGTRADRVLISPDTGGTGSLDLGSLLGDGAGSLDAGSLTGSFDG